jgi:shikimate dehydrogenase
MMTMPMITARTRLYALLGEPVDKSLSPRMQNAWMVAEGFDAAYVALNVRDPAAIPAIGALGFGGVNITAPHKEAAFAAAHRADAAATALKAANVLRVEADGTLSAFNTDADGFLTALERLSPGWRERRRRGMLVIGAGGAAKAVCYGLVKAGAASVTIVNRTLARAQEAADLIGPGVQFRPWEELGAAMSRSDLIVNGVTHDDEIAWPFAKAKGSPLCIDLRYGQMKSRFLREAFAAGFPVSDGLPMLIHQGALAFQHWFDVSPDIEAAYELLTPPGA